MNIKNPETNRLARQLADLTGESVTEAVTVALKERLERVARERHREEQIQLLLKLGRECAEHMNEPFLSTDHGDLLYDDLGLPR